MHADATPSFRVTRGPSGTLRGTGFAGCGKIDLIGMTAIAHGLDARSDFGRVAQLAAEAVGAALESGEQRHRREP